MFKRDKKNLNFIYDDDLEKVMKRLNIFDDFIVGKKRCKFCRNIIDGKNLHSLFREFGEVKFICDSPECIKELMAYIK